MAFESLLDPYMYAIKILLAGRDKRNRVAKQKGEGASDAPSKRNSRAGVKHKLTSKCVKGTPSTFKKDM